MAWHPPSCPHDDDRLCLPSASPPRKREAGKKESTSHPHSQACQRYVMPSSLTSCAGRICDVRTVGYGSARHSAEMHSAKVVLVPLHSDFDSLDGPSRPARAPMDRADQPVKITVQRYQEIRPLRHTTRWVLTACCSVLKGYRGCAAPDEWPGPSGSSSGRGRCNRTAGDRAASAGATAAPAR